MKIYLENIFSIKNPFDYATFTPRAYFKSMQVKEMCIQKKNTISPSLLVINHHISGDIIQEDSPETVKTLNEYMNSFYIAIDESDDMIPFFQKYYQWLMIIFRVNPTLDPGLIQCSAEFLNVNLLLKDGKYKEAQEIIHKVSK